MLDLNTSMGGRPFGDERSEASKKSDESSIKKVLREVFLNSEPGKKDLQEEIFAVFMKDHLHIIQNNDVKQLISVDVTKLYESDGWFKHD